MANKNVPAKGAQSIKKEPTGQHQCSSCGVIYSRRQGNYFKSGSPLYANSDQFVHICKNCTNNYYKKLLGFYNGDAEKAIRRCCEIFDVYYNDSVFAASGKEATDSRIATFLSKLNMVQFKSAGKTFLNTLEEEKDKPPRIEEKNEVNEECSYVASPEIINFFGSGHSNENYEYLEREYKDWTSRYTCETKAEELIYKKICLAQLADEEAQRSKDSKEMERTTKMLQGLLNDVNITPKNNADQIGKQESFGTMIRDFENKRPIPEPDEEWADVDGIYKYLDTYFFGQLCELVGIQNPHEEEYLEEKSKHTIAMPEWGNGLEEGESTLLDKVAKKKSGGGELADDSNE